jgi:hypothetical protein
MDGLRVGAGGFEPPTPCTPCRCASRTALRPGCSVIIHRQAGAFDPEGCLPVTGEASRCHAPRPSTRSHSVTAATPVRQKCRVSTTPLETPSCRRRRGACAGLTWGAWHQALPRAKVSKPIDCDKGSCNYGWSPLGHSRIADAWAIVGILSPRQEIILREVASAESGRFERQGRAAALGPPQKDVPGQFAEGTSSTSWSVSRC